MLHLLKKINWQYAIGEIIIVIIGISIAFALNNWAEQKSNDKYKRKYLENLKENLEYEVKMLENNIKTFESNIAGIQQMYQHFQGPLPGRDTVIGTLGKISHTVNFVPKDVTYQALINSGDFKLIDNFELKTKIEEHYANHSVVKQEYARQLSIHENYLGPYFINEIDFGAIRQGDHSYLDKKGIRSIVSALDGTFRIALHVSKAEVKHCEELITTLNKELE